MLVCWFPHRLWNRLHTSARLGPTSTKQPEPLEIAGLLSRMYCISAFSVDRVVELWGTLRELPNMLFVVQFMLHRGVVLCGLKLSKDNLGMKTRSNTSLNRMRSGLSHQGFDWQIDAEAPWGYPGTLALPSQLSLCAKQCHSTPSIDQTTHVAKG